MRDPTYTTGYSNGMRTIIASDISRDDARSQSSGGNAAEPIGPTNRTLKSRLTKNEAAQTVG